MAEKKYKMEYSPCYSCDGQGKVPPLDKELMALGLTHDDIVTETCNCCDGSGIEPISAEVNNE